MGNSCFPFWCMESKEVMDPESQNNMKFYVNEKNILDENYTHDYDYYYFNSAENMDCVEF
tara:strand:+ start:3515 stop:3694 length:180 start_codon:yes stop_codon:yes gene_type:complete